MSVIEHEDTIQGLVFRTRAEKVQKDWYSWQVELAGPSSALEKIGEVEYILHPTFPNRIRRMRNAEDNFRLTAAGWGEFNITVNVYYKDGDEKTLIVPLKLFS